MNLVEAGFLVRAAFGFASDPSNFTMPGSSTERRVSDTLMLQRWISADKTAYSHGVGEHRRETHISVCLGVDRKP